MNEDVNEDENDRPRCEKTPYVLMMENEALVSAFTAHAEAKGWNTSRSTRSSFGAWENGLTLMRFLEFAEANGFIPKRTTPTQRWYEDDVLDMDPDRPAWNDLSDEQRQKVETQYTAMCQEYQAFNPNDPNTWMRRRSLTDEKTQPEGDKDSEPQSGDPAP